jgi:hypothetical protein
MLVLIVVVAVMAAGGLLARAYYRRPAPLTAPTVTVPTTASTPPSKQPGPSTVQLEADAKAHPDHDGVRAGLQAYYDAINHGDYYAWKGAVTRARAATKTYTGWQSDFRTTQDGSIVIYRIDSVSTSELRVYVGLTSVQDPSAAPKNLPLACLRWNLVLPMALETGLWKVDVATAGDTVPPVVSGC